MLGRLAKKSFRDCRQLTSFFHDRIYMVAALINRELKKRPGISLKRALRAYRNGFVSESIVLFGLDEGNSDNYLTNWQAEKTRFINSDLGLIHDNKVLFQYILCPTFDEYLPDFYGYIADGELHPTPFSSDYHSLVECVNRNETVVVKPANGSGGGGVTIIKQTVDGYQINGKRCKKSDVNQFQRELDDYLISEFVNQETYAEEIYPGSMNTIRIITMIDPDTHEPFIAGAVHRIGTNKSAPTDNWSRDGLSVEIDMKSGKLGSAVSYPKGDTLNRQSKHPDTGAKIEGVKVPGVDNIRQSVLEMAEYIAPLTPYVGWDIIVTGTQGEFAVVEGNNFPHIDVMQPHVQLLAEERNRRFYEHYDII